MVDTVLGAGAGACGASRFTGAGERIKRGAVRTGRPTSRFRDGPSGTECRCSRCREWKPLSAFTVRDDRGVPRCHCKKCRGQSANRRRDRKKYQSPLDMLRVLWCGAICRRESDIGFPDIRDLFLGQGGRCYWTGVTMTAKPLARHPTNVSIDRIDSSKGYVRGNIALCCWAVNSMKGGLPPDLFVELCRKVVETRGSRSERSV